VERRARAGPLETHTLGAGNVTLGLTCSGTVFLPGVDPGAKHLLRSIVMEERSRDGEVDLRRARRLLRGP
jgi:hypothetical protein